MGLFIEQPLASTGSANDNGGGGGDFFLEKELSVLVTVLALHLLVASKNVTCKDYFSSHTLNKLLGLQITL